jgi:hypothetical protein
MKDGLEWIWKEASRYRLFEVLSWHLPGGHGLSISEYYGACWFKTVTLWIYIRELPVRISAGTPAVLTEDLHSLPLFLQEIVHLPLILPFGR